MNSEENAIAFDDRILISGEGGVVCPLRTVPQSEFAVRDFCQEQGIVSYLPVRRVWRGSDYIRDEKHCTYRKGVFRPMFASYIFVKMDAEQRARLLATGKIIRIFGSLSEDCFLREIRAVHAIEQIALEEEVEFNADSKALGAFVVESGIWAGVTGWLEKKGTRFEWSVWLSFAGQYVKTFVDPSTLKLKPIEKPE